MPILSTFPMKDKTALSKQDKLTGAAGQVVGFNAAGEAAPQSLESLVNEITSQDIINIWNETLLAVTAAKN